MQITLIDNYDSFTYNLLQYLQDAGAQVTVLANDTTLSDVIQTQPDGIVISPGPGTVTDPADIGISRQVIDHFMGKVPILGVCLGHQLLGLMAGGAVTYTDPQHGVSQSIQRTGDSRLLKSIPQTFHGMRYHSQVLGSTPSGYTATAQTPDGVLMAMEDPDMSLYGVQFHPESIGTPQGRQILQNFITICHGV